jgi:hypothetical protein
MPTLALTSSLPGVIMSEQYGRKYQILVSDQSGNALDVSELRCTFSICKKANQATNYADISIYNLDAPTEQAIIKEGYKVIVLAGYQDGAFGKIFEGEVFQPLWEREGVVDYKLTLHCIDGDSFMNGNFVEAALASGYDYSLMIQTMAAKARTKMPVGSITESLSDSKAPRGRILFGDPREMLRNIARDNNASFFSEHGLLHMANIVDVPSGDAFVLSPESGLIGTPCQTDEGFSFRCLINPNIQVINGQNTQMYVKLDNSAIRQEKAHIGQIISMLDQDMTGKVIEIEATGDTRGDAWWFDVVCVSKGGKVPLMLQQ